MHHSHFSPNSIWWTMVVIWGATPMQCIAVLPCTCFAPRCSPAISWLPKSVSVLHSRCVSWHLGTAWTDWVLLPFPGRQFGISRAPFATVVVERQSSAGFSRKSPSISWFWNDHRFGDEETDRLKRHVTTCGDNRIPIPKFRIAWTYIYIFMNRIKLKPLKIPFFMFFPGSSSIFNAYFHGSPGVSQSAAQSQKCWAALLALTWRLNLAMKQLMMPT